MLEKVRFTLPLVLAFVYNLFFNAMDAGIPSLLRLLRFSIEREVSKQFSIIIILMGRLSPKKGKE